MPRDFSLRKSILHDPDFLIDKKSLNNAIITPIAKNHLRTSRGSLTPLKDLGNEYSFKMGFSFGLKDLAPLPERDAILAQAKKEVAAVREKVKDKEELDKKIVDIYQNATDKIEAATKKIHHSIVWQTWFFLELEERPNSFAR